MVIIDDEWEPETYMCFYVELSGNILVSHGDSSVREELSPLSPQISMNQVMEL